MAAAVFHDQIEALRQQYIFADSSRIEAYLEAHPVLLPLLEVVKKKLGEYFGPPPVRLGFAEVC